MKGFSRISLYVSAVFLACLSMVKGSEISDKIWADVFSFQPPAINTEGVCAGTIGELPSFTVDPDLQGEQIVRVSIPFAPAAFPAETGLKVVSRDWEIVPDIRILTLHPGSPQSVRRAIITFPFTFKSTSEHRFDLKLMDKASARTQQYQTSVCKTAEFSINDTEVKLWPERISINNGGAVWESDIVAPERNSDSICKYEVIEDGHYYKWVRLLIPDPKWPRIIEVRADSLGSVVVQMHLQRLGVEDVENYDGLIAYAPTMGWQIQGPALKDAVSHSFQDGQDISLESEKGDYSVSFPTAAASLRGQVEASNDGGRSKIVYLRCEEGKLPMQIYSWRKAGFSIRRANQVALNTLLEPRHTITINPQDYDNIYHSGSSIDLSRWPRIDNTYEAIWQHAKKMQLKGDDLGQMTRIVVDETDPIGSSRLNHCLPVYSEYYRSNDDELRNCALLWCDNYYDKTIWWNLPSENSNNNNRDYILPSNFGGTRHPWPGGHQTGSYQWRSNGAPSFCHKGFESFFYAYEETGDPRMATALHWQINYVNSIHTNTGQTRNIGVVSDLMHLYEFTGVKSYKEQALRLYQELRTRLSDDNLFSQGGGLWKYPLPFIDFNNSKGKSFPKTYIIGYALKGLPGLYECYPDEPRLYDLISACANFLAESQDSVGAWRYPQALSETIIPAIANEHCYQLVNAAKVLEKKGQNIDMILDAFERNLQLLIHTYNKTGTFLSYIEGWELDESKGDIAGQRKKLSEIYDSPEARDRTKDYTHGQLKFNKKLMPETIFYTYPVLDYYLQYRPAERLFNKTNQLQQVLERCPQRTPINPEKANNTNVLSYGIANKLPVFTNERINDLDYPLAFQNADLPFKEWKQKARNLYIKKLGDPPTRAAFEPAVIATEDRGSYQARKIAININEKNRIKAYLLIPKGDGPFPGILALHDHGAHFFIGKEKMVRPFDEPQEVIDDAQNWVNKSYGGRFVGDELAKRGYVVLSIDVLFWGDRGRKEGVNYAAQQALTANMLQLGYSWAGYNIWDDIRSAEFLQSVAEVDPDRIGCVGLSMGANRAWHLPAATDRVKCGAVICWMSDTKDFMTPGQNQTKGFSAFSMIHPDLRNYLDYPDVASIACPKPMLFYAGRKDGLFGIDGVNRCFEKMQAVWTSQDAEDKLVCKWWDVPHTFNVEMQDEVFEWFDENLK